MLRAHTEALNATHAAARIINTQDVFRGALVPAGILLALYVAVTWALARARTAQTPHLPDKLPALSMREWSTALATLLFIVALVVSGLLSYPLARRQRDAMVRSYQQNRRENEDQPGQSGR